MLPRSQQIAFAVFALVCLTLALRGFLRMYRRIVRGRRDPDRRSNQPLRRAWYALRATLTQERTFRRRPVLSVLHLFIFYAFVLYLLVNLVDAAEGFVSFAPIASSWPVLAYRALTDFLSVAAILSVLAFVVRRYASPGRRDFGFNPRTPLHPDVARGVIARDSAIVSAFIVVHIGSRVLGNAAKLAMQGTDRAQPFSSLLAGVLAGPHAMLWRIAGYWGALGSVLLFLVYFPYSKHIHLLMAPVKYFFRRDAGSGELPALALDMEAATPELGAATLGELTWPRLLDGYACIQCNRCQDVCPASATGKALSPAALEINKRMVLNTIAREVSPFSLTGTSAFERGSAEGPQLLEAVISPEAVWACTTCGACMEVCPTQDEQMLDIIDLRRNLVLAQGEFPAQLQTAFRGMERNKNPWGLAQNKRMSWAEGLDVPTVEQVPHPDVLYWVGCAASYDPGAQKTARAVVNLLREAEVNFAVLGERETCTGDSARRAGNELLYQELARGAIETLDAVAPKQIIASCPHCVNVIGAEFPQMGGCYRVAHHTEYLAGMVANGKLKPEPSASTVAFHDPCYLGRHRGTYEEPRSLLRVLSNDVVELGRNRANAFCCGAGGAQFWKEEEPGDERVSENRFREAQAVLAAGSAGADKVLAVGCPFCKSMLESTPAAGEDATIAVRDVAELLWDGVRRSRNEELTSEIVLSDGAKPASPTEMTLAVEPVRVETEIRASEPNGVEEVTADLTTRSEVNVAETGFEPPQAQSDERQTVSDTPSRKKWTPKAKSSLASAASSSGEAPPAPAVPEIAEQAAAPPTGRPEAPVAEPAADSAPAPLRKKWQPRGKA